MKFLSLIALACTLLASPARAQSITEEQVTQAMQAVGPSLEPCIGAHARPLVVELVVVVDEAGKATLRTTQPTTDATTLTCLAAAVSQAAFPATGGRYEITYPVAFAEGTPPPPPAPVVEGESARPVALATAPPVTHESTAAPPQAQPVPESTWMPLYRQGRSMFVAGIVLTAGGALVAGVSGFFILLSAAMGNVQAVLPTAAYVALGGLGLVAVGVPLLVVGIVKKRRASRLKAGVGLEATLHTDLVTGAPLPALGLRF